MAGGDGGGGAGSDGGSVAGGGAGASATVVVASVVGGAAGGTTTTASTVWAMPLRGELADDDQVRAVDRLRRRIDEQHVTAEARHLGSSEDLLLLELAGNDVSEDEVL